MAQTQTGADSAVTQTVPPQTVVNLLNDLRDTYADTQGVRIYEARQFRDAPAAKVPVTHTHQQAFSSAAKVLRRHGFRAEKQGQRWSHIAGTTPTVTATFDPDAYNMVALNEDRQVAHPPSVTCRDREFATERAKSYANDETTRDDLTFAVQHCATQEIVETFD
jgi:hypothetical protein